VEVDPLLALLVIVPPLFFVLGAAMQWVLSRFRVSPFNSLLVTFGITVIIEALLQGPGRPTTASWSRATTSMKLQIGTLYLPVPELITLGLARGHFAGGVAAMRSTDLGKAMRAAAEDAPIAAAFGVNQNALGLMLSGLNAALAGVAGVCIALAYTLSPSQIYAWIGVVFAAVMLGGLGSVRSGR
jgi:branched-chain amino acid transport system permease protein